MRKLVLTVATAVAVLCSSAAAADVVVPFGEGFQEMHAGMAGRMVVAFLKGSRKLVIVDVVAGKIAKEIPVSDDNVTFACSRDHVVIAYPGQKRFERWNLRTLERETVAQVPGAGLREVRIGAASWGPVYLWFGGEIQALDLTTFKPLRLTGGKLHAGDPRYWFAFRVSADGKTVTGYHTGISPGSFGVNRVVGRKATGIGSPHGFSHANRWFQPSADGTLIFNNSEVYNHDGVAVSAKLDGTAVSSADPRFFLTAKGTEVGIWTVAERRLIHTESGLPNSSGWGPAGEPMVIFLPEDNRLAVVQHDRVTIRTLDIKEILLKSDRPITVISKPPAQVAAGTGFSYFIDVVAKHGPVTYKLTEGPPGMKVSPDGEVTWRAVARHPRPKPGEKPIPYNQRPPVKEVVFVTIRDAAGHEHIHAFETSVVRPGTLIVPPMIIDPIAYATKMLKRPNPDERRRAAKELAMVGAGAEDTLPLLEAAHKAETNEFAKAAITEAITEIKAAVERAKLAEAAPEMPGEGDPAPAPGPGEAPKPEMGGPAKSERVEILKADYGVGNRKHSFVREFQKLLDANPLHPVASTAIIRGDPAPNQRKTLTVTYRYGGQTRTVVLGEEQVAVLPEPTPDGTGQLNASMELRVVAAYYGRASLDMADVTDTVRRLLANRTLKVDCNQLVGRDPSPNVRKWLVVWYEFRGRRYAKVGGDGDVLVIPAVQ